MVDNKTTYHDCSTEASRKEKVWVRQPASGLEKRQCTLQLCFSPEDNNVRPDIIFRGGGKRLSPVEKAAYHKGVDIYFQKNAWADTAVSCEWVKKTLKPAIQEGHDGDTEFLLYCDNLNAQTSDEFKRAVRKIKGLVWFGPPGATDIWQPVDAGYGSMIKRLVTQEQDKWLEMDENFDRWAGNGKPLSASDRRILISHWVGEAHKRLQEANYDKFRRNCFEKTGCLMTADGSDDSLVKPEGLPGYKIPPPLPMPGPDEQIIEVTEPAQEPGERVAFDEDMPNERDHDTPEEEEDIDEPSSPTEGRMDLPKDRTYSGILVGKKIRGLYHDGWHVGVINYYNTKLQEYHIEFDDSTEDDYIKESDIDGIEMIIIQ